MVEVPSSNLGSPTKFPLANPINPQNIAVFGASGAIGSAFLTLFRQQYPTAHLHAFSRSGVSSLDPSPLNQASLNQTSLNYLDESSLARAANQVSTFGPLDLVIVATGLLHGNDLRPEKSLKDICADNLQQVYTANVIVPALIAKHFTPLLNRQDVSYFAALSARVGSISDNRLGGWYAYRSAKAALNMLIKTTAIEVGRRNKHAVIVGLHPGTVVSELSRPFRANVPPEKLFSNDYAATQLLGVLDQLTLQESGKCFAWDGREILP